MATIRRFEDIEAWKTARTLTKAVYGVTGVGAFARDFGLRDQMQRSAVSILSNIAEGFESRTVAQFIDYLGRAKASAGELRAQLYVACDIGYLSPSQFDELYDVADKCSRQLSRFVAYLESQPPTARVRETDLEYHV